MERHRRRAGSCCSCHRARASADGRAYLASDATDVCPLLVISMGVLAPASASWVSAECRSPAFRARLGKPAASFPGRGGSWRYAAAVAVSEITLDWIAEHNSTAMTRTRSTGLELLPGPPPWMRQAARAPGRRSRCGRHRKASS